MCGVKCLSTFGKTFSKGPKELQQFGWSECGDLFLFSGFCRATLTILNSNKNIIFYHWALQIADQSVRVITKTRDQLQTIISFFIHLPSHSTLHTVAFTVHSNLSRLSAIEKCCCPQEIQPPPEPLQAIQQQTLFQFSMPVKCSYVLVERTQRQHVSFPTVTFALLWGLMHTLKSLFTQKCISLVITSLCLTFIVQNNVQYVQSLTLEGC